MEDLNLGVWENFTNRVKELTETRDLSTFMTWDILINTMIAGVDDVEINYLTSSNDWNFWVKNLEETVLKPNNHPTYQFSSTNNLHHAYSLQILSDKSGKKLTDFGFVTEFGGGYGNTARLFKKINNNVIYNIYDIPEFNKIQEYYLKENGINDVRLLNNADSIQEVPEKSLFIALWSISETPVATRNYYIDNLKMFEHDTIFVAMGETFYNENNMEWLNSEIIPKLETLGFKHEIIKIEHGNGMYYFLADKVYK
jgi:hypothetical protein